MKSSLIVCVVIIMICLTNSSIIRYTHDLWEGSECGISESYYGRCTALVYCANVVNELKKNNRLIEVCSFNTTSELLTLVCCSQNDFEASKRIAINTKL